jgi:hypothetical protein
MKYLQSVMALVFLVASYNPCFAQSSKIPDFVPHADEFGVNWVSQEEVNRDGVARWEALTPEVADKLREYLSRRSQIEIDPDLPELDRLRTECLWIGIAGLGAQGPGAPRHPGTMTELRSQSPVILRGVVEEAKQGFLGIRPGTVYQVRVGNNSASSAMPATEERVLVFFPEAMVRMGQHLFCSTDHRDFAQPTVGKEMLLFLHEPAPAPPTIAKPFSYRIFFERPDQRLAIPSMFKRESSGSDPTPNSEIFGSFENFWSWATGGQDGSS